VKSMGRLEGNGRTFMIPSRCLVGRSEFAHFRPGSRMISGEHAVIYWSDTGWCIRDLSSRNGTWVNGLRLDPAVPRTLTRGDTIRFAVRAETYGLLDDMGPAPSALHTERNQRLWGTNGLLVLPDGNLPEASVYADRSRWMIDVGGETMPVASGDQVTLPSGQWTLELPCVDGAGGATETASETLPFELDQVEFRFDVSRDEERIGLALVCGQVRRELGIRASYYLLLTLARVRLADGEGREAGWIDVHRVADMLKETVEKVNLDVHRLRRLFSEAGVLNAHLVVERRPRQLRIGTARISVCSA
jgi:hypothetical protein